MNGAALTLLLLLIIPLTFSSPVTYYTYVPADSLLELVGYNSSTRVDVYNVSAQPPKLIASLTVDRMELRTLKVPGETHLKVVADKPLHVSLHSNSSFGGCAYYICTSGGFLGREYIFAALPTEYKHVVFAVDRCTVRIKGFRGQGGGRVQPGTMRF